MCGSSPLQSRRASGECGTEAKTTLTYSGSLMLPHVSEKKRGMRNFAKRGGVGPSWWKVNVKAIS